MRRNRHSRRVRTFIVAVALVATGLTVVADSPGHAADIMVYKAPGCGCCDAWADHLRINGFTVTVHEQDNLDAVKALLDVPAALHGCHTATIGGYVIEGHVPANDIRRLLSERPHAVGLAVPGMPVGSPGMEQEGLQDSYDVILFNHDGYSLFKGY